MGYFAALPLRAVPLFLPGGVSRLLLGRQGREACSPFFATNFFPKR